ncbi:MAG: hypothetical protein KatS3mg105_3887 [Gemmatales bacterium]|nr:MAG: hypothetical protein KatS3mg105_3887 [Gemmatales bacterium]
MKTIIVCFPFDLFGSAGAGNGAKLLADAIREMLADNRREKVPTRALAYAGKVQVREESFDTLASYQNWRQRSRRFIEKTWKRGDRVIWITGNHLGTLPVYDALAQSSDSAVIQFDAHLDVYNLTDCTSELSHGNFLLHVDGRLPPIINVGHRELLLRPDYVGQYYQTIYSNSQLAVDPAPAIRAVQQASRSAQRVFIDLDCDVFDPAYFPAVSHPAPFGLSPALLLRFLEVCWCQNVVGLAISEFDPACDDKDRSLATLVWLIEYLLLKQYE